MINSLYWTGAGVAAFLALQAAYTEGKRRAAGRHFEALKNSAYDLGYMTGEDWYYINGSSPCVMDPVALDTVVATAETVEAAERYQLIYEHQRGKLDGWRQALKVEVVEAADGDVEREFYAWQRQRGEAA